MGKVKIQAYISPETKKAIEALAEKENRSVSNTAGTILDAAVKKEKKK